MSAVPPPVKPTEPVYEDVAALPDQAHDWGLEWDGDRHQGRICEACEEFSACDMCNRDAYSGLDCLRQQAENRNRDVKRTYVKALERFEAQMDYYRTISTPEEL